MGHPSQFDWKTTEKIRFPTFRCVKEHFHLSSRVSLCFIDINNVEKHKERSVHHLQKIANINIEELDSIRLKPEVDHERKVAVFDLLEENYFAPIGGQIGPYDVDLSIEDGKRLVLDVAKEGESEHFVQIKVPLMPLRKIVKDYFLICDSYFSAIKTASPAQIEAIDMGRRGLHNEGSVILRERLEEKVAIDHDTARRLFTLVCVLHIRQ